MEFVARRVYRSIEQLKKPGDKIRIKRYRLDKMNAVVGKLANMLANFPYEDLTAHWLSNAVLNFKAGTETVKNAPLSKMELLTPVVMELDEKKAVKGEEMS